MSQLVLDRLKAELGAKILATTNFRGDECALVAPAEWFAAAKFLREDPACAMNHFVDITAVDYPEREPETPRFDVLLSLRSLEKKHRIRMKTQLRDGEELATLCALWQGANWTEREVFDMFGIRFAGHPDLRRILMYDEFVGYPLRKDYPIQKTQPLVQYRDVGPSKLAPFGAEMGNPFGRVDWLARLGGGNRQVSPAIGLQQGQRSTLSTSSDHEEEN